MLPAALFNAVSDHTLRLILEIILLEFVLEFRDAYMEAKRERLSEVRQWQMNRTSK